jgi:hypothetical protein
MPERAPSALAETILVVNVVRHHERRLKGTGRQLWLPALPSLRVRDGPADNESIVALSGAPDPHWNPPPARCGLDGPTSARADHGSAFSLGRLSHARTVRPRTKHHSCFIHALMAAKCSIVAAVNGFRVRGEYIKRSRGGRRDRNTTAGNKGRINTATVSRAQADLQFGTAALDIASCRSSESSLVRS